MVAGLLDFKCCYKLLHFFQHLLVGLAIVFHDRHRFVIHRHCSARSILFAFQRFDASFQQGSKLLAVGHIAPSLCSLTLKQGAASIIYLDFCHAAETTV